MFAKSFLALDGNGRLIGARTAQTAPYDRYTCHLCNSTLLYHLAYDTERPWFEHISHNMTENGQQHCPYAKPDKHETRLVHRLRIFVPNANPIVFRDSWHCSLCDSDYHGERYCLSCQTGRFSLKLSAESCYV